MGKSSPSPPPPPDPNATAAAAAAANKEAAIASQELNMINQVTPFGDLLFTPRGESAAGTPQYTATQTLAPAQQRMLDLTNAAGIQYGETALDQMGQVSGRLGTPLDFGGLGPAPVANEDTRLATSAAIMGRLDPQIERDRQRLETRLATQGIPMGSDAYNEAMIQFQRGVTDTRLGADAQAGSEMARMFGLEQAARNQGINEMLSERSVPLNELAAMLTGAQVQQPGFAAVPQAGVAAPDVMSAVYGSHNAAMNNYNQQMAQDRALTQGIFSLLGAGAQGAGMMWGA